MYGDYKIPFEVADDELSLSVKKESGGYTYTRQMGEDVVSKQILTDSANLNISPIEPLNLPMKLTSALLIELENTVVIKPQSTQHLFLTFPVELGVFLYAQKGKKNIDIFSLVKPKYTLYGDVSEGTICRYWKSSVHTGIPQVDKLREGVIELVIKNGSLEWIEMHRVVFNAYGMKIFYDRELVAMKARMSIRGEDTSVTDFKNTPIRKGMRKALEIYQKERQPLKGTKFMMEGGL